MWWQRAIRKGRGAMKAVEIAGLWGAFLSTLLAAIRVLPERPRFYLEPATDTGADIQIRVVNPASEHLYIRDFCRINLRSQKSEIGIYTRKTRLTDIGVAGSFKIGVPGKGEQIISVNCIGTGTWFTVFLWRHPWPLPVSVPQIVLLSKTRADALSSLSGA
jgi:hypothetical protein